MEACLTGLFQASQALVGVNDLHHTVRKRKPALVYVLMELQSGL
jgi:hypothetical protein